MTAIREQELNLVTTLGENDEIRVLNAYDNMRIKLSSFKNVLGMEGKLGVEEVSQVTLASAKSYTDNKVKTDVPAGAVFTDTLTTINGKTGAITKADIIALGIPAQDTVVDISSKADITYVDSQDALKADKTYVDSQDALKADKTYVDSQDALKADLADLALKADITYVDSQDALKADKAEVDTSLELKADITYVNNQDALKADKTYVDNKVQTDVPVDAEFTDTTYSEITVAEIEVGTASTLRTITGRRVKYIFDKVQAWISNLTKADVGLSNVDNVKQMPISNGVLENYREKLVTLSGTYATAINLSSGNVFAHSLTGLTSYIIYDAVSGQAHSFTLIITQTATVRTVTFPSSVKWQGGEVPDLSTANKTYVLTFLTIDGGTTWLGMFGGEF